MKYYDYIETLEYLLRDEKDMHSTVKVLQKCEDLTEEEFGKQLRKIRKLQKQDGRIYGSNGKAGGSEILLYRDHGWVEEDKYSIKNLWYFYGDSGLKAIIRNNNNQIIIIFDIYKEPV